MPADSGLPNAQQKELCWKLKEIITEAIKSRRTQAKGVAAAGWKKDPALAKDIWCGVQISPARQHRNANLAAAMRVLRCAQWPGAAPELRMEFAEGTIEMGPKQSGFQVLAEWRARQQRVCFRKQALLHILPQVEVADLGQRLLLQGEED